MIKHIEREIYEVTAKTVDAAGGYSNLSGTIGSKTFTFPMSFDSHQNSDDLEKNLNKAYTAFDAAGSIGREAAAQGRPLTIVSIIRVNDGRQLDKKCIGSMPTIDEEVPDPEPEPEENGGE